jgi:hypothetical protein
VKNGVFESVLNMKINKEQPDSSIAKIERKADKEGEVKDG